DGAGIHALERRIFLRQSRPKSDRAVGAGRLLEDADGQGDDRLPRAGLIGAALKEPAYVYAAGAPCNRPDLRLELDARARLNEPPGEELHQRAIAAQRPRDRAVRAAAAHPFVDDLARADALRVCGIVAFDHCARVSSRLRRKLARERALEK